MTNREQAVIDAAFKWYKAVTDADCREADGELAVAVRFLMKEQEDTATQTVTTSENDT